MRDLRLVHPRSIDALLAVLVAGSVLVTADVAIEPGSEPPGLAVWWLAALLGGLQLGRRHHPFAVLCASTVALILYHLLGFTAIGLVWPLLIPYGTAAAAGHLGGAAALAAANSVSTALWRTLAEGEGAANVLVGEVMGLVVVGLALAVGEATWQRGRWATEVRARLARAERDAYEESQRRLTEERLAMASDLHDVAGHSLVVIGLQLRNAEETFESDPQACRRAIADAIAAHGQALRETTATVRILREGLDPARAMTPDGSLDLGGLEAMAAAAGLDLAVNVDLPNRLQEETAVAAYRILQEAMTNTVRHARARRAAIELVGVADGVNLRFSDDGEHGRTAPVGGYGLRGMAERAQRLGGSLTARPLPQRGFLVEAWLPAEAAR